jgi:hypothetical protein
MTTPQVEIGARVKTLRGDWDEDGNTGRRRNAKPGEGGCVWMIDDTRYHVVFYPSGVWIVLEPEEINDPEQYEVSPPVLVREFSPCGPCLTLGTLIHRTEKTVIFRDRYTGKRGRRGGWKVEGGYIHLEPCSSCRDHAATQYPNGYMD